MTPPRPLRVVRASNTRNFLGLVLWKLSVLHGSVGSGTPHVYRNGWIVRFGQRRIAFIPTTEWRTL